MNTERLKMPFSADDIYITVIPFSLASDRYYLILQSSRASCSLAWIPIPDLLIFRIPSGSLIEFNVERLVC